MLRFAAALGALALSLAANAQFPSRPIHILVTIPPGGAPDIVARVVGEKISRSLGQPVVVDNKPAANGNAAAAEVAHAPADGHTLLLGADSLIAINPHVYSSMPIDPLKDLTPISSLVSNQFVLSINPNLPPKTFPEFIEYAKKANPPLAYASGGNGSQHQLTMEMLKERAGFDMVHVPYKGGAPATAATMSGEVAALFSGTSSAPQIRAGRIRALAVAGAKRSPTFPDLPTIGEFYPGFANSIWLGLFGPAGMPQEVVDRLRTEVQRALEAPDVKASLMGKGSLETLILSPQEFEALIRRDYEKYGKLIKKLGIKAD
ncbi:MAG TPA: tripartite tricarboxylate transporter substrate binding protein [Burkholderiales bacterium]|nr:tripartite tricarboxylate transporter substrate binding protein [Burkholderiales bacterium]